jgi:hypothetical protein
VLKHTRPGQLKCVYAADAFLIKILGVLSGSIAVGLYAQDLLIIIQPQPQQQIHPCRCAFDTMIPGPASIQPFDSIKKDASGIPLPTENRPADEEEVEGSLHFYLNEFTLYALAQMLVQNISPYR